MYAGLASSGEIVHLRQMLHDAAHSFPDVLPRSGRFHKKTRIRVGLVAFIVALQLLTGLFFLIDVIRDYLIVGVGIHTVVESIGTVALFFGVGLGGYEMTRMIRIAKRTEAALQMASGAFAELLNEKFAAWRLTPSEADVALLTLKGYDGPQIAGLRGTAPGTVRAQLTNIYGKSGCSGRGQFVSLFIDALLDGADDAKPLAVVRQGG